MSVATLKALPNATSELDELKPLNSKVVPFIPPKTFCPPIPILVPWFISPPADVLISLTALTVVSYCNWTPSPAINLKVSFAIVEFNNTSLAAPRLGVTPV